MVPKRQDPSFVLPVQVPSGHYMAAAPKAQLGATQWTTELPSLPGWYGLRHAIFQTPLGQWHEPSPVMVELLPDAAGQLLVYVPGTTWTRSVADLVVGEWIGPLSLPE